MCSHRAQENGLALDSIIDDTIGTSLIGDPGRLGQILVNLIGNAIKFTEQGSVTLDVNVDTHSPTEVCLHFTVTDTGIGIPGDHQETIFDAFSQADNSTTRNHGGTGLGLAIVSKLVRQMGGRIWVESQVGIGTEFHFTANFGLVDDSHLSTDLPEPPANRHEHLESENGEFDRSSTLKILLAEDNRLNQILATEIL